MVNVQFLIRIIMWGTHPLLVHLTLVILCCDSYQYPYDGPLRKACRTTPEVNYIDDILTSLNLTRKKRGGQVLPKYYKHFYEAINPGIRVYMMKGTPVIYMQMRQAGR